MPNHRFQLREREKQARVFLALMNFLESVPKGSEALVDSHRTASMMAERYVITQQEVDAFTAKYFPEGPEGPINDFASEEKRKLVILMHLAKRFEPGLRCAEPEINLVLKTGREPAALPHRIWVQEPGAERLSDEAVAPR